MARDMLCLAASTRFHWHQGLFLLLTAFTIEYALGAAENLRLATSAEAVTTQKPSIRQRPAKAPTLPQCYHDRRAIGGMPQIPARTLKLYRGVRIYRFVLGTSDGMPCEDSYLLPNVAQRSGRSWAQRLVLDLQTTSMCSRMSRHRNDDCFRRGQNYDIARKSETNAFASVGRVPQRSSQTQMILARSVNEIRENYACAPFYLGTSLCSSIDRSEGERYDLSFAAPPPAGTSRASGQTKYRVRAQRYADRRAAPNAIGGGQKLSRCTPIAVALRCPQSELVSNRNSQLEHVGDHYYYCSDVNK